jgi:hypothetical protein
MVLMLAMVLAAAGGFGFYGVTSLAIRSNEVAGFGTLSPLPVIRHADPNRGTGQYAAAEVPPWHFR